MMFARTFTFCAFAAALALLVSPAAADQGRGKGHGGQRGGGHHITTPPNRGGAGGDVVLRTVPPAARTAVPRVGIGRGVAPGVVVAPPVSPQWAPGPVVGYRRPRGGPAYASPYRYYRPAIRYARPYYTFRPRVSIGIGFWAGFSVPFPGYAYVGPYGYGPAYGYPAPYPAPYPVPYPVPYASPYPGSAYPAQPPGRSMSVAPGSLGGLSFQITPGDAEVWVDGGYAGRADEFGPYAQPLALTPGVHHLELRAPGFQIMSLDVTVTAGHVIPYQGTLIPGP